jgi:hypothetical protein
MIRYVSGTDTVGFNACCQLLTVVRPVNGCSCFLPLGAVVTFFTWLGAVFHLSCSCFLPSCGCFLPSWGLLVAFFYLAWGWVEG